MNFDDTFFDELKRKAARAYRLARSYVRVLGDWRAAQTAWSVYLDCCYLLRVEPQTIAI